MNINIKDKLKELRHKKGITQEALANYLGITPQSVGKWERGEGYPDITLLPRIAFYFGVTVDELLSVDRVRIDEKINEYMKKSAVCKQIGDNEKNLEIWERAYAEFPNECRVIDELMFAINRDAQYPCPADKADRIISLAENLLEKSTEIYYKENALHCLCFTYSSIGNKEKALYYADQCGTFCNCAEGLKTIILDGEEGINASQEFIQSLIRTTAMTAANLVRWAEFSHEEKIEANRFAIDITKRLYSDGNVGFNAYDLSLFYFDIACEYALLNDKENTLEAIENSCKYAVIEANIEDRDYTAPLVNRLKIRMNAIGKNYRGNSCNLRLKELEDQRFDFVREEKAFADIVSKLQEFAEEK